MPKGPKGQKRPADVIGNAVRVMRIATGEAQEDYEAKPEKNAAAAELGRKGGAVRAKRMTPERRAEIARGSDAAVERRELMPDHRSHLIFSPRIDITLQGSDH
jgi:hypothetical protein